MRTRCEAHASRTSRPSGRKGLGGRAAPSVCPSHLRATGWGGRKVSRLRWYGAPSSSTTWVFLQPGLSLSSLMASWLKNRPIICELLLACRREKKTSPLLSRQAIMEILGVICS